MSRIEQQGENLVIIPDRDIVASMSNEFKSELHSLLEKRPKELIIDFQEVNMVDSVGIGVLIAAHNSLKKIGGKLKLVNLARDIYNAFVTMRLNHHFTIEKT